MVLDGIEAIQVLFKSHESDVYLGVGCLDLDVPVIELFLRSGRVETYHFHVPS